MRFGKKLALWKKKEENGGYRSKTGIMEADKRESEGTHHFIRGKGKCYNKATAARMRRSDSHPSFHDTSCHDPLAQPTLSTFLSPPYPCTTPYKNAFFSFKSRRNLPRSPPPIGFSLIQDYVQQKPYKSFSFSMKRIPYFSRSLRVMVTEAGKVMSKRRIRLVC